MEHFYTDLDLFVGNDVVPTAAYPNAFSGLISGLDASVSEYLCHAHMSTMLFGFVFVILTI